MKAMIKYQSEFENFRITRPGVIPEQHLVRLKTKTKQKNTKDLKTHTRSIMSTQVASLEAGVVVQH